MAVSVTGTPLESVRTATTDPYTFNFTPGANTRGIILMCAQTGSSTDQIVSVTFNGRTLNRVLSAADTAGEPGRVYIYFVAEDFAASSLQFSIDLASATTDDMQFGAISLTTATGYPMVVATNSIGTDTANPSVSMSVKGFDSMAFGVLFSGQNAPTSITPNANMTVLFTEDLGTQSSSMDRQTTSSTSNFTYSYTIAIEDVALAVASFAETPQAFAQAQAKINAFGYPGGKGQAQAKINTFGVNKPAQAQATIAAFGVTRFAQAQAKIQLGAPIEPTSWSSVSRALNTIKYADNKWVGAFGSTIYVSTDLFNWSAATSSPAFGADIDDIAYGNGYWVTVSEAGAGIAYASDPAGTWTINTNKPSGFAPFAVEYGDKWRAISRSLNGTQISSTDDPTATWADDGRIVAAFRSLEGFAYGNSIWVIGVDDGSTVNHTGTAYASTGIVDTLSAVAYANGLWVIGADNTNLAYSTNPASSWTARVDLIGQFYEGSIAWGNTWWLAVNEDFNVYTTQTPSGSWNSQDISTTHLGPVETTYGNGWWAIAGGGELWVALGHQFPSYRGFAQAQAQIISSKYGYAQSQARIGPTTYERILRGISGLQSFWTLGEPSGSTAISDYVGAIGGTVNGTPTFSQASDNPLQLEPGIKFNSISDYLTFGDNYDFTSLSPFSLLIWVKHAGAWTSGEYLINKGTSTSAGLSVESTSSTVVSIRENSSGAATSGLLADTWQLITATANGTNHRIHISDIKASSTNLDSNMVDNTSLFTIGRAAWASLGTLSGTVAAIAVFNVEISFDDVQALYTVAKSGAIVRPGQAQALIVKSKGLGQALALISGDYNLPFLDTFTRIIGDGLGYSDNGDQWIITFQQGTYPLNYIQANGSTANVIVSGDPDRGTPGALDIYARLKRTLINPTNGGYEFSGSIQFTGEVPKGSSAFIFGSASSRTTDIPDGIAIRYNINNTLSLQYQRGNSVATLTTINFNLNTIYNFKFDIIKASGNNVVKYKIWDSTGIEPGYTATEHADFINTRYPFLLFDVINTNLSTITIDNLAINFTWITQQGQAQASIFTPGLRSAQAQAKIVDKRLYANTQTRILQTYRGYAQAQASINQTQKVGQALGRVKQTYNGFAQAGATIGTFGYGQAQASISAVGINLVYSQAQADIKQTYNTFAQSQADIKQTYNSFAQAQAQIKQTYNAFAQAQTAIKTTSNGFAQAQANILATSRGFAQAQTDIKSTYNQLAQSQANIKVTSNSFAQAQAHIVTIKQVYSQAQARILATYNAFAQAQAGIKATSRGFGQVNADIKQTYPLVTGGTVAQDTFTDATLTLLENHTPEIGGPWSVEFRPNTSIWMRISANTAQVAGTGQTGFGGQVAYKIASISNGYLEVQMVVGDYAGTVSNGLILRHQTGTQTYYAVSVAFDGALTLERYVAGSLLETIASLGASSDRWIRFKATGSSPTTLQVERRATQGQLGTGWQIDTTNNAAASQFSTGNVLISASLDEFDGSAWGFDNLSVVTGEVYSPTFAQAQAKIKVTTNVFAQARADIKAVSTVYAQSQADIKQTYRGFAQSQADIKATSNFSAQAQADIKQTYQQYAQAQAQIKQTSNSFAQAQADIKQTYNAFAQAQGSIKQTYNGFAQSQADIRTTYNGFGQAQANIVDTFEGFAQAQGSIVGATNVFAQSQARILTSYNSFAQVQGKINAFGVNGFAQALANIKGVDLEGVGQAQARINAFGVNGFSQSQADIKATSNAFAQAMADIKATSTKYAQAQANILHTYQGYAQSQAEIKQTYNAFAQAQGSIKATYNGSGQAQADVKAVGYGFANAQSDIKQIYNGFAQARADILVTSNGFAQAQGSIKSTVNGFAQAQADIKATSRGYAQAQALIGGIAVGWGQAQADIKAVSRGYAQATADIKVTSRGYAQAQVLIVRTFNGFAQAQAEIKQAYNSFAQSNAGIKQTYQGYAQALADIKAIGNGYGQAQSWAKITSRGYAQAAAWIRITGQGYAQAQAGIKATYLIFAQSQADILATSLVFAQTQAQIKQNYCSFGQAQTTIIRATMGYGQAQGSVVNGIAGYAQAQAIILVSTIVAANAQAYIFITVIVSAQAQALIASSYGFAQAQGLINVLHTLKRITGSDRVSLRITAADKLYVSINAADKSISAIGSDQSINITNNDRAIRINTEDTAF